MFKFLPNNPKKTINVYLLSLLFYFLSGLYTDFSSSVDIIQISLNTMGLFSLFTAFYMSFKDIIEKKDKNFESKWQYRFIRVIGHMVNFIFVIIVFVWFYFSFTRENIGYSFSVMILAILFSRYIRKIFYYIIRGSD